MKRDMFCKCVLRHSTHFWQTWGSLLSHGKGSMSYISHNAIIDWSYTPLITNCLQLEMVPMKKLFLMKISINFVPCSSLLFLQSQHLLTMVLISCQSILIYHHNYFCNPLHTIVKNKHFWMPENLLLDCVTNQTQQR
jgi:hypothetical protein